MRSDFVQPESPELETEMKPLGTPSAIAGITFDALLGYNEQETSRWREWFSGQPEALLQVPAGDPSSETV